jgi:hypothetical protein
VLEILLLWGLCRKIGEMVEAKGHSRLLYQGVLVAMWFGGELTGAIIGVIVISALGGTGQRDLCFCYLCAFFFAAVGAGSAFLVAAVLPNQGRREFYDREYYRRRSMGPDADEPRRRIRRDEEDDRFPLPGRRDERVRRDDDPIPLVGDEDEDRPRRPGRGKGGSGFRESDEDEPWPRRRGRDED